MVSCGKQKNKMGATLSLMNEWCDASGLGVGLCLIDDYEVDDDDDDDDDEEG